MRENRFYICRHCGNLVGLIQDGGAPLFCCGQKMEHLQPGTVEASAEKHVPVVTVSGNIVEVSIGSAPHPMTEEHSIQWVYLQTSAGGQRKCLAPGGAPTVRFALTEGEHPIAAFAYCNLHGLWKTEL